MNMFKQFLYMAEWYGVRCQQYQNMKWNMTMCSSLASYNVGTVLTSCVCQLGLPMDVAFVQDLARGTHSETTAHRHTLSQKPFQPVQLFVLVRAYPFVCHVLVVEFYYICGSASHCLPKVTAIDCSLASRIDRTHDSHGWMCWLRIMNSGVCTKKQVRKSENGAIDYRKRVKYIPNVWNFWVCFPHDS